MTGAPGYGAAGPGGALFCYGTLGFACVREILFGRAAESVPVTVRGWRAAALRDRPYPGLVPDAGGMARGHLVTGFTGPDRLIADAFEGSLYELRRLPVDGGGEAWAYVCADMAVVLDHDWDRDHFRRHVLPDYLEGCRAWRAAHRPDESTGWV